MREIRPEVLAFARNAMGTRVWARTHVVLTNVQDGTTRKSLAPVVTSYTFQGTSFMCKDLPLKWSRDEIHILTDASKGNDFRGRERRGHRDCNMGFGECWDLAYAALDANNGLTRGSNYIGDQRIWSGKKAGSLAEVKGGEILELSPSIFSCTLKFQDNGAFNCERNSIVGVPHTAIIKSVNAEKGLVEVFEQNTTDADGNRQLLVNLGTYALRNMEYTEGNQTVLQVVGGNRVRTFYRELRAAADIDEFEMRKEKLDLIITKMRGHISGVRGIFRKIKIYIPQAP